MELKQLEYFIVICEHGSFNKAAEFLYTSQPNVSKVISNLENELGRKLLERTNKGVHPTPYGKTVLEYAKHILQNVQIINSFANHSNKNIFSFSSYPSNILSRVLAEFYKEFGNDYTIEHFEGTVEEICENVAKGLSEIGIVYISQKQLQTFIHILGHKKLHFQPLDRKEACIYVGPQHSHYQCESIDASELKNFQFIRGIHDYFSMEHHLSQVNLGSFSTEDLNFAVHTTSSQATINLLLNTDLCSLGIDFSYPEYKMYDIKNLKIKNSDPFLLIGYIYPENASLSEGAEWFIEKLKTLL